MGSLSIFRVCKQTKHEAEPLFWSENTFHAVVKDLNIDNVLDWLYEVGKENASLIRQLLLQYQHSLCMQVEFSNRLQARQRSIGFGHLVGEIQERAVTFYHRDRDLVSRMRFMF